jgi:hypothetical protein
MRNALVVLLMDTDTNLTNSWCFVHCPFTCPKQKCLVPIINAANHHRTAAASLADVVHFDRGSNSFRVVAGRSYAAGEQFYILYGAFLTIVINIIIISYNAWPQKFGILCCTHTNLCAFMCVYCYYTILQVGTATQSCFTHMAS